MTIVVKGDDYFTTTVNPIDSNATYQSPADGITNATSLQLTNTSLIITGGTYANTYNLQPTIPTTYTICDLEDSDCESYEECNASLVCEATDEPPIVSLIMPTNAAAYTINTSSLLMNFTCNISDNNLINNATLYINGIANFTNSSVNTQTYQLNHSTNLTIGSYTWNCAAYDNNSIQTIASNYSFTINALPPPSSTTGGGGGSPPLRCDITQGLIDFEGHCEQFIVATNFLFNNKPESQCKDLNTYFNLQVLNNEDMTYFPKRVYLEINNKQYDFTETLTGFSLSKNLGLEAGHYDYTIVALDKVYNVNYNITTHQTLDITECSLSTLDITVQNTKSTIERIYQSTKDFIKNPTELTYALWQKKPYHIVVLILIIITAGILIGEHKYKRHKYEKKIKK